MPETSRVWICKTLFLIWSKYSFITLIVAHSLVKKAHVSMNGVSARNALENMCFDVNIKFAKWWHRRVCESVIESWLFVIAVIKLLLGCARSLRGRTRAVCGKYLNLASAYAVIAGEWSIEVHIRCSDEVSSMNWDRLGVITNGGMANSAIGATFDENDMSRWRLYCRIL